MAPGARGAGVDGAVSPSRHAIAPADGAQMEALRGSLVQNFQERMQLRRSLIELQAQNLQVWARRRVTCGYPNVTAGPAAQNNVEISRQQVEAAKWATGGGGGSGGGASAAAAAASEECAELTRAIVKVRWALPWSTVRQLLLVRSCRT